MFITKKNIAKLQPKIFALQMFMVKNYVKLEILN